MTHPRHPVVIPPMAGIEAGDPAHALVAAFEAAARQNATEMSALVRKLADDVVASSALAEQAARGTAEGIITQSGSWAAEQIRLAANEAAETIQAQREAFDVEKYMFIRAIRTTIVIWSSCCFLSGLGLFLLVYIYRL